MTDTAAPLPVARLLVTVEEGSALGFPLARIPEREARFRWIVKLYDDSFSFATLAPHPPVNSLEEGRRLGAVTVNNASAPRNVLLAAGFTNLDQANSEDQNALKLFAGNVDAWFSVTSTFRPLAEQNRADSSRLVIGAPVHPIEAYLIGSKSLSETLVQRIQDRFAAMKQSGEYAAIMASVSSRSSAAGTAQ
ncbi:hypothetical protein CCP1ISM_7280001 [Azospirillaceae bacterium]